MTGENSQSFAGNRCFSPLTGVLLKAPRKGDAMIVSVPVDINLLLKLKENYAWPRPDRCPGCNHFKVWGHGFAYCCFDFSTDPIPIKRYRCPNCGCVIRLRPEGYFNRFQASVDTIRKCIDSIVTTGKAIKGICRQRQYHWFAALKKRAVALFGLGADLKQAFESLIAEGVIPVSRVI